MDARLLLIGAVALALVGAGCIHDGGDAGNASVDGSENASGMEEADDEMAENVSPDVKPDVNETYGDCPAGTIGSFDEVPEPADIQGAMGSAGITITDDEVSGSVAFEGRESHDGRETCHVVVRYDEPLETSAMAIDHIEVWRGTAYHDLVFYDAGGTRRLRVVREGNETTVTRYDEQGDEAT